LNRTNEPDTPVVSATFFGGRTTQVAVNNYIPDAQIWGDGRIIWVEHTDSGERRVLEGRLAPNQMRALLQRVVDDGFFSWQDYYVNRTVADAPEQCLSIELERRSKKVCEYFEGAPQAFHDLYAYIAQGAEVTGTDYMPETGLLKANPLHFPEQFSPPVDWQWPTAALGMSLSEAVDGIWVEGAIFELAWRIVNAKWKGMIVQDDDAYYEISVQVPGVSWIEPPAR
jgi:hypothetical protein